MTAVTFKYPLGAQAQDKHTGFKGTISLRCQALNGMVQYALQPRMKEGEGCFVPDANIIDEESMELLSDAIAPIAPEPETVQFKFETGDKVRNRVNGFEGVVTRRSEYINGCHRYTVEGPLREGKEHQLVSYVQVLELVDKGLNAPEEKPVERKRTGGASTREALVNKEQF